MNHMDFACKTFFHFLIFDFCFFFFKVYVFRIFDDLHKFLGAARLLSTFSSCPRQKCFSLTCLEYAVRSDVRKLGTELFGAGEAGVCFVSGSRNLW